MRDIIGEMRWGMMGGGYAGRYWKDEGIVWGMRDVIGRMRVLFGVCGTLLEG